MSTLRSLISLGFLVGPLVGTIILGAVGYKGLFLGTSAIFITIASSIVLLFLPKKRAAIDRRLLYRNHLQYYYKCFNAFLAAYRSSAFAGSVCRYCYGQWTKLLHGTASRFTGNVLNHILQWVYYREVSG